MGEKRAKYKIYLIQNEELLSRIKIGFTSNGLTKRSKQLLRKECLETQSGMKLRLIAIRRFKTEEEARHVEKLLHLIYKKKRIKGEWFALDTDEIKSIISGWRLEPKKRIIEPIMISTKELAERYNKQKEERTTGYLRDQFERFHAGGVPKLV